MGKEFLQRIGKHARYSTSTVPQREPGFLIPRYTGFKPEFPETGVRLRSHFGSPEFDVPRGLLSV